MAKGGNTKTGRSSTNPEAEERKRLKKLAITKGIISETPAKASSLALNPSKIVTKHHGKDILRKSTRKNRFLFSFPGLIGPVSGGKIGELQDLGSKNPILYIDYPQGRMKLFGTIVYPKNRYLTLQFSKGGKNVMCEDYFDTMIVFSDTWWIGSKEENPEETQLSFPENMTMVQQNDVDFKGGAGSTSERIQGVNHSRVADASKVTDARHKSPERESVSEFSDSESDPKDTIQTTATRHSTRTSGKTFKFAESSSADDAFDMDINTISSDEEKDDIGASLISGKKDAETEVAKVSEKHPEVTKAATQSKNGSHSSHGPLVQATIATLFKKKEEKMAISTSAQPTPLKVSRKRLKEPSSEEKIDQSNVKGSAQKGKAIKESKTGTKSTPKKKKPKVSDDEIEEISDPSEDSSDEDWGA
uniref:DNA-binding protein RHL1 n=1 Tax=Erigeron canadensis TaxID=72917 RepID=UPI001CB9947B|nr:DNA-binding protein RHL1 [Erigeron canadensis]